MRTILKLGLALLAATSVLATSSTDAQAKPRPYACGIGYCTAYRYTVLSTNQNYCSSTQLAWFTNNSAVTVYVNFGDELTRSYTYSGSVSASIGDKAALTATIGYDYSTSRTISLSGGANLAPGQTLRVYRGYQRDYVRQQKYVYYSQIPTVPAGTVQSTSYVYTTKPNNGLCFG